MPSQKHFSTVLNNRQLGLFRPLKAVARVRIPSGLPVKPPLTRPDTTSNQRASSRVVRQGRARDARTPIAAALGTLQISRLACQLTWGPSAGGVVLSRWTAPASATCPATTRLDDQASSQAEGATRYVGDRQAGAICLKGRGTSIERRGRWRLPDQKGLPRLAELPRRRARIAFEHLGRKTHKSP